MVHETRLSATFPTSAIAEQVARSLAPEAAGLVDDRSRTTLSRSGAAVTVHIDATDLIALRAAINTWCELLHVAETVGAIGGSVDTG